MHPQIEGADVLKEQKEGAAGPSFVGGTHESVAPSDAMLAFVSHQLRTPVAVIVGFAQTLADLDDRLDGTRRAVCVDAILRNARSLSALIDDFHSARTIETGRLRIVPERTDLAELVRTVVRQLGQPDAAAPRVAIDGAPLEVDVDPARIAEALRHLVLNAIHASSDDGVIDVVVGSTPSVTTIEVTDRGRGVSPGDVDDLFRMFVPGEGSLSGVGLGLYIARGIARAHGGDIVYEPRVGGGARFVLCLPPVGDAVAG